MSPDGKFINKVSKFIEIIRDKLNASINMIEIVKNCLTQPEFDNRSRIELHEHNLILDFYASPDAGMDNSGLIPFYGDTDHCFLVPLPPKIAIYEQILIRPMEREVWFFLGISIATSAFIWRLFKNFGAEDSLWHFLFGMYAFFVGQSVEFRV